MSSQSLPLRPQGVIARRDYVPVVAKRARANILVETLLAILVATLLTTTLVNMFMQVRRAGGAMQSELLVSAVAQEVVDQLRALPFQFIKDNAGTHVVQVAGNGSADPLFPRPLLRDLGNLDYSGASDPLVQKGSANTLHTVNVDTRAQDDSAKVEITERDPNSLNVTITIRYLDGTGKIRQHQLKTILTSNGVTG